MNAVEWSSVALALVAILTSVGAMLKMASKFGYLQGSIEAYMRQGNEDRARLHQRDGYIEGRLDRHIEGHGRGNSK